MYAGKIVDRALAEPMFDSPEHPYTKGLFASLPRLDRREARLETIEGIVPPITDMPGGCRFHTRCSCALPRCSQGFTALLSYRIPASVGLLVA